MKHDIKIADSMRDLIGEITLVRLHRVGKETGCEILVKPEFMNTSSSIKDCITKLMIDSAQKGGKLTENTIIVEATGSTGSELAFISAVKGRKYVAYTPTQTANPSSMPIILAFEAELEPLDAEAYEEEENASLGDDSSVHGNHIELTSRMICHGLEHKLDDTWCAC